ncbi:MAG TPA: hypothetical protein VLZ83_13290 [Edaphocola sp.]|nr:hypothetical protein [Edaphocola sp.]
MKTFFIFSLLFVSACVGNAQQIIVKLNITECVNCTSTLERINNDDAFTAYQKLVVLPSEYLDDASYIRSHFDNLESYKLIFDDEQYKQLNISSLSEIRIIDKEGNVVIQKTLFELANTNLKELLNAIEIQETENIQAGIEDNNGDKLPISAAIDLPFRYKSSMDMAYFANNLFFLDKLKNSLSKFNLKIQQLETLHISTDSLVDIVKAKYHLTGEINSNDLSYKLLSVTTGESAFLNIRVFYKESQAPPIDVVLDLVSGKYAYMDYVYDMDNPYIFPANYLLAKYDSLYVVKKPLGDDKHSKNTLSLFVLEAGRYVERFELPSIYEGVYTRIWGDLYSVTGTFPFFTLPLSNKLFKIENNEIGQIVLPDNINTWPNQVNSREDITKLPKLLSVITQSRYNQSKGEVYMLYSYIQDEKQQHQLICYHINNDKFTVKPMNFPDNISHKLLTDDGSIIYVDKSKNRLVIIPFFFG